MFPNEAKLSSPFFEERKSEFSGLLEAYLKENGDYIKEV